VPSRTPVWGCMVVDHTPCTVPPVTRRGMTPDRTPHFEGVRSGNGGNVPDCIPSQGLSLGAYGPQLSMGEASCDLCILQDSRLLEQHGRRRHHRLVQ